MQDFLFYNAGCTEPRGLARIVVLFRRLIRRILRPIFLRQVDLFQELAAQIEAVARQCAELQSCLQGQARRQEALLESLDSRLRATLAEQANREEQARQALENGLRAAQTSELAQYRRELERYLSDCDAIVQRLTLIDEDLERLHGRGNGKSRPAA